MTRPVTATEERRLQQREQDPAFFLPDLCQNQAVLLLVLVAEIFSIVLVLASSSVWAFDWERLAFVSLFVQWVALSSAGLLCQCRSWLSRMPNRRAVVVSYLLVPMNAWVFAWLSECLLGGGGWHWRSPLADAVLTPMLITALIAGLVMRYFYLQSQLLARRQSELLHRIQALQSRIKPHFLFNSMNIIASLIHSDPDTAEQVVEDLAALFRASLNQADSRVPVDQELALCRRYLHIESLRLGDRLQVEWDVRPLPEGLNVPLLTLQPLLENAVVHGVAPLPAGGVIEVQVLYQHGVLEMRVTNPVGPASPGSGRDGNHMALENTRSRLAMLYGQRAKLTSYREGGRFVTHLSYPCQPGVHPC